MLDHSSLTCICKSLESLCEVSIDPSRRDTYYAGSHRELELLILLALNSEIVTSIIGILRGSANLLPQGLDIIRRRSIVRILLVLFKYLSILLEIKKPVNLLDNNYISYKYISSITTICNIDFL